MRKCSIHGEETWRTRARERRSFTEQIRLSMCPDRRHKVGEGLFLFHFHKLRNKDLEKKKSEDIWWGCLSRIKHYRVNSISLLVWQWMEGWNESKDFDWIHWDSLLRNHHHQSMMNVVEKISRVTNIKQRNKITPPLQQEKKAAILYHYWWTDTRRHVFLIQNIRKYPLLMCWSFMIILSIKKKEWGNDQSHTHT